MEKEINNESTKPYELLAQLFGTTSEEIMEKANKHNEDIDNKLVKDFEKLLSGLDPVERDILKLRFGLDSGRKRTLEEVGAFFGVDAQRIRQIETRALGKLRKASAGTSGNVVEVDYNKNEDTI